MVIFKEFDCSWHNLYIFIVLGQLFDNTVRSICFSISVFETVNINKLLSLSIPHTIKNV